jgi:DNA-binding PadR family transcriptional regulator
MYPYEITTTLRDRNKEDSIRLNFGSLYAVIKSLEKHGFIVVDRVEREGKRPERIVYALTEAGDRETSEWLRELLEKPAKEYPAIETGLSLLPLLPPAEVSSLLRRRLASLDRDIAERERSSEAARIQHLPELFMIEFTFKLAMLKAEREVIAGYADSIDAGTLGGQETWARMHRLLAEGHSRAEVLKRVGDAMDGEVSSPPKT